MERSVLIVGGGPAGCSCALWLKQLGCAPSLLDAGQGLGGLQNESPYPNTWVGGVTGMTGQDFAARLDRQVTSLGIPVERETRALSAEWRDGSFFVKAQGPKGVFEASAPFLVAASGSRPRDGGLPDAPGLLVGPGRRIENEDFSGCKVAILGGGDNAFENHGIITAKGAGSVTLFARSLRARRSLRDRVPQSDLRVGPYEAATSPLSVNGERFERIVVLYGWRPNSEWLTGLAPDRAPGGEVLTEPRSAESSVPGLYAIGEAAGRAHPCCSTAMADGVTAATDILRRMEGRESGSSFL